ncbi:MAG: c-type cytochrome, partial [Planctomycetaceae bacterium]|nr:c-type cytochrome [Planctomycetaceae bacterium]
AFSVADFPETVRFAVLNQILTADAGDRWIRMAALISVHDQAAEYLQMQFAAAAGRNTLPSATLVADLVNQAVRTAETEEEQASVVNVLEAGATQFPELRLTVLQSLSRANRTLMNRPEVRGLIDRTLSEARTAIESPERTSPLLPAFIRSLELSTFAADGERLVTCLATTDPPAVQRAAIAVLGTFSDEGIASILLERLSGLSPAAATDARDALLSRPAWTLQLLKAWSNQSIPGTMLTLTDLQRLALSKDDTIRSMATQLISAAAASPREDVIAEYQSALVRPGNIEQGKALFVKHCSICHKVGDLGNEVGPNLATMKSRGAAAVLTNVLDPNREVNPAWKDYVALTVHGTSHNGIIASESATNIVLRRAEGKQDDLQRSEIDELRDTGRSLMPEGLEKQISIQDMADLIGWLMQAN